VDVMVAKENRKEIATVIQAIKSKNLKKDIRSEEIVSKIFS